MKPPKLRPGDLIAVISPSNTVANRKDSVEKARHNFEESTGFKTILAPNALKQHFYSSGTIKQRVDDFHWALRHPDVKAIVFSVGGNTAIELVDKLDYELIKQNPKIICGISDATTLLNSITAKTGLITFLGIEFLDFENQPMTYEVEYIKRAWLEGSIGEIKPNPNWRDFENNPTSYRGWQCIREGNVEGVLIGGNFSSFAQLYHTEYMPKVEGSIITMECFRFSKKAVHQSLSQLRLWGTFDKINGLIVGYCLGSDNPDTAGNDRSMKDLVLEATDGYKFPIMWIGEIGHRVENIIVPIGARTELDASNKKLKVLEDVTL